jgi:hypothetical protein
MNVDPDFDPVQSVGGIRYITVANVTVQIYGKLVWLTCVS